MFYAQLLWTLDDEAVSTRWFGGDVTDDWYSPRAALRGSVRGVDLRSIRETFEPPISGFPSRLI